MRGWEREGMRWEGEPGEGRWGTYQSEVRYSLALVRVRASMAGAARVLVAPVRRARARASLLLLRPIMRSGDGF